MKKFTIIYVGKLDFRKYKGGIETFSKILIKNVKIPIFSIFFDTKNKCEKNICTIKPLFNFLESPFSFFPFSLLIKHKPKLIHINLPNPFLEFQFLLYFLLRGKRERLLITYHADAPHYSFLHTFFDFLRYFWLIPLLKLSDKIVITSKYYLEKSFPLRHVKDKIRIIPLGIDFNELKNSYKKSFLEKKWKLKNKEIILFVGRLCEYKGLEYLIKAFKNVVEKNRNVVLVIVGYGPLLGKLKKMTEKVIR